MKYKLGDRVIFKGNVMAAPDIGTVTHFDGDFVYARWDSDGMRQPFNYDDDDFQIVTENTPVEITRDVVEKVLSYYFKSQGYSATLVTENVVDSVLDAMQKDSDPDYQLYLKLKARFEKE